MDAILQEQIDERILRLMHSNNAEEGLRLLMDTYQERLYGHIRGLVQLHQDADDVLQNTFIKVYKGIGRFKGESKLYTWLYRIATNESLTMLQQRRRKNLDPLDERTMHDGLYVMGNVPDAEHIQLSLKAAIGSLPPKQRAVFQLRYYDEMSYDDLAEITGTSVGALKASYHHAVKKIEAFIKSENQKA